MKGATEMTIGDIIRESRKRLDITQEDLAKAAGTTKATVSRWDSGDIRRMNAEKISAVCNKLQLDERIFFQREEVIYPDEWDVIRAYRNAKPGTRASVRKLLDLGEEQKTPAQDSSMVLYTYIKEGTS